MWKTHRIGCPRIPVRWVVLGACFMAWPGSAPSWSWATEQPAGTAWTQVVIGAEARNLPAQFLRRMPPEFVTVEFRDLRRFAAEYHPDEHRMVLNRTLSLNAAGRALRPLSQLTHQDLATLYHELFHAYMDFIVSGSRKGGVDPLSDRLLAFARAQQRCRYERVLITPVVQRKAFTEVRYLTDQESWEALNETWAVFVGWLIWTTLELREQAVGSARPEDGLPPALVERLQKADEDGILRGYYEPEDPQERMLTQKRYLAPAARISAEEVATLLELVFEQPSEPARGLAGVLEPVGARYSPHRSCRDQPVR